jgi:hypothetical protein
MLQYRYGGDSCVPRSFSVGNSSQLSGWTYTLESGFLEMLLQSEHRTLDPEEAGGCSVGVVVVAVGMGEGVDVWLSRRLMHRGECLWWSERGRG